MIVKNKSMDSLLEKFADEEIGKRESHGDMNADEDDAPVFGGAFAGLGGIGQETQMDVVAKFDDMFMANDEGSLKSKSINIEHLKSFDGGTSQGSIPSSGLQLDAPHMLDLTDENKLWVNDKKAPPASQPSKERKSSLVTREYISFGNQNEAFNSKPIEPTKDILKAVEHPEDDLDAFLMGDESIAHDESTPEKMPFSKALSPFKDPIMTLAREA